MQILYKSISFLVIVASCTVACKKTEYEYAKRPDNDIKQFIITGSTGDATKCRIDGDTINIYWNPDVALPAVIRPSIVVSEKATVSPASGESVALHENTTFKVTAEDGTVRTYSLKLHLYTPLPTVSSVTSSVIWLSSSQINIYGENFLANNDTSEVSAYLQRDSDGFEIPLELNKKNITNYSIVAQVPAFSAEQGVGLHRLFVKIGDRESEAIDLNFYAPSIDNVTPVSSCRQAGQTIHAGDTLVIDYTVSSSGYDGRIASFYGVDNIGTVAIYFSYDQIIEVTDLVRTENSIKLKIPESVNKYIGQSLSQCRLYFKSVIPSMVTSISYRHGVYFTSPCPVAAKP